MLYILAMHERRALQILIILFGFIPVGAGLAGVIHGGHAFGNDSGTAAVLDTQLRYLSGLLLGIGLCFWSFVPQIETKTLQVRILTTVVFIGGLSRLAGSFATGDFSPPVALPLIMELAVTPALCLWQGRVAAKREA